METQNTSTRFSTKGHEVTPDDPAVGPGLDASRRVMMEIRSPKLNSPIIQHKSAFSCTFGQF